MRVVRSMGTRPGAITCRPFLSSDCLRRRAVSAGDLDSKFDGVEVHTAARTYLETGQLVLPLDRILDNASFRDIPDPVLSYREAGSFVRFLIDRYGLDRVLALFPGGSYTDSAAAVRRRFEAAFGVTVAQA